MRRYRIGRTETNDIVLTDSTVSREHAELAELGEGRFAIKDLGSSYGIAIREGGQWAKVTEAEITRDAPLRIGDVETSVADLLRDTDRTVVRPNAPQHAPPPHPEATAPPAAAAPPAEAISQAGEATSPPVERRTREPSAPSSPDRTAPPRPAPPRPAPPRPAAPRPAAPSRPAPFAQGAHAPPQPAAPAFQFLRDLPAEKRPLVWLGVGFAAFLLIALITLVLAIAL